MSTLPQQLEEMILVCRQGNLERVSEFLTQEMKVPELLASEDARELYHQLLAEFDEQTGPRPLEMESLEWELLEPEDDLPSFDFGLLQLHEDVQGEPEANVLLYPDFLDQLAGIFLRRHPDKTREDFEEKIYSYKEGHLWFLDHYGIGNEFVAEDAYEPFFEHQERFRYQKDLDKPNDTVFEVQMETPLDTKTTVTAMYDPESPRAKMLRTEFSFTPEQQRADAKMAALRAAEAVDEVRNEVTEMATTRKGRAIHGLVQEALEEHPTATIILLRAPQYYHLRALSQIDPTPLIENAQSLFLQNEYIADLLLELPSEDEHRDPQQRRLAVFRCRAQDPLPEDHVQLYAVPLTENLTSSDLLANHEPLTEFRIPEDL